MTAESQLVTTSTKVPIDPPGAVLGAIPFTQYLNGQHQIKNVLTTPLGSHRNGGGVDHPIFHPLFPSVTNWGYNQPHYNHQSDQNNPHLHQHLHQQQPAMMITNNQNLSQQWMLPYFLTPFVSAIGPPGNNHESNWLAKHASICNNSLSGNHIAHENALTSSDADETMSINESVESTEKDVHEFKRDDASFVPSTFAPPECVKIIRARQNAADSKHNAVQPRQTRSMSRRQRRDNSKSSKSKSRVVPTVTHQACSPHYNIAQVNGGCPKSSAVSSPTNGKNSSAVQIMTVLGKRVIMIDPVRKVFIIDLLSPEMCDEIRAMADNYTQEVHTSGLKTETWRTLYTYTKMDLPVAEVKDMAKKYTEHILLEVKKIVGEIFGGHMRKEAMNLRPRSWKEPHLLLYQKLDDRPHHTGIEMHYDGCDITWQAMLTRIDEYEGGGTYFRALRKTILLQQGQVLVHPGELYHMGCDITYGVRCLLVCFTDGMNPKILDDSKSHEDHPSYRKNVVLY